MLINIGILNRISLEYRGDGHYCAFINAITLKITHYITITLTLIQNYMSVNIFRKFVIIYYAFLIYSQ